MTFADLANALRRFWPLALLVFALTVGAGVASLLVPDERFQSETSLVVQPTSAESLSFGATEAVQYLLPPTVKRAQSDDFRIDVRHQTRTPREVPVWIDASNEAGTSIITLAVQSTDPAWAEMAAIGAARDLSRRPVSGFVTVSVLEPASAPESLRDQRALPILLGSIVLAVILATFAVLAANALWRRLPGGYEIAARFDLDLLGEIPRRRKMPPSAEELFRSAAYHDVREAFERLGTTVQRAGGEHPSIAVIAWGEGEGKTTVVSHLAYAMARFGEPVTAVDFDLRKPRLHEALGTTRTPGVGEHVTGASIDPLIHETELPELRVIPAGQGRDHPVRMSRNGLGLLGGELLDQTVVVDTPPMFAAETMIVAAACDAVIVVVDARKRSPTDFEHAIGELRGSGAAILGMVVNNARLARSRRPSHEYYAAAPLRPGVAAGGTPEPGTA